MNHIRQTIYMLKREYGRPIEIYTVTNIQTDLETGQKILNKNVYKIRKAILLPRKLYNEVISLIGITRKFHYGNLLDKDTRIILIDSSDYPKDYTIKLGDYFITDHERYNITDVNTYDTKYAIMLTATKIPGEQPRAIIAESSEDRINISQGVSNG